MDKQARALVTQAQAGDRSAFDRLVELYRPHVEARVHARLGIHLRRHAEVQDVVQETFTRALATLDRFQWREGDSFLAWLHGIAENVIRTLAQKDRRPGSFTLQHDPADTGVTASRQLRREERFARLEDALQNLSEDHRQVILMARIERLTIGQIAERMSRSPDAVKQLLSRALKQLRLSFGNTESLHLPTDRRLGSDTDA